MERLTRVLSQQMQWRRCETPLGPCVCCHGSARVLKSVCIFERVNAPTIMMRWRTEVFASGSMYVLHIQALKKHYAVARKVVGDEKSMLHPSPLLTNTSLKASDMM